MKNKIIIALLFFAAGLQAQIRPDQQPEKTPEGTDAIYTQENGQLNKILFDSAFYYFIPRIKTDTLTYSITSANNPDSLRGFFVVDNTSTWYYVDSAAASVSIGSGGGGTTQSLSFSSPNLSISGGNTVDLSPLVDNNAVLNSDYSQPHSVLAQQSGSGTPTVVQLSNNEILGKLSGSVTGLSAANIRTIINVENGATADQTLSIDSTGRIFDLSISGGNSVSFEDTNTQLSQSEVEDFAGGLFSGNTETLITATYQTADNTVDLVVENDLSLYDNSTSGFLTSEVDGSTTNEIQTISVSGDDITLSDSGGSVSVINTVESNTAGSTTITIDLESARNRIVQVDMTSASTASTVTLSASNPVTGGVYTFHLQNTDSGGHDVDFPTNFLKADGTAWDESTTVNYAADEWLTCYYDGTNFYCK